MNPQFTQLQYTYKQLGFPYLKDAGVINLAIQQLNCQIKLKIIGLGDSAEEGSLPDLGSFSSSSESESASVNSRSSGGQYESSVETPSLSNIGEPIIVIDPEMMKKEAKSSPQRDMVEERRVASMKLVEGEKEANERARDAPAANTSNKIEPSAAQSDVITEVLPPEPVPPEDNGKLNEKGIPTTPERSDKHAKPINNAEKAGESPQRSLLDSDESIPPQHTQSVRMDKSATVNTNGMRRVQSFHEQDIDWLSESDEAMEQVVTDIVEVDDAMEKIEQVVDDIVEVGIAEKPVGQKRVAFKSMERESTSFLMPHDDKVLGLEVIPGSIECDVQSVKLEFVQSRHKILVKLLSRLFTKWVHRKVEKSLEHSITEILNLVCKKLNAAFANMSRAGEDATPNIISFINSPVSIFKRNK